MKFEIVPEKPEPIKKDDTLQVWLKKIDVKGHKDGESFITEEVWIHVKRKDSDRYNIIAAINEHGLRLYAFPPSVGIAMNDGDTIGNTVKIIS